MGDLQFCRTDFPILQREVYGKPLVYLDNAATTQKPASVIDEISTFYSLYNSNIHRGVHFLSEQASELYEDARQTVCSFIRAASPNEIVFTRGTTEAINLVAFSFGETFVDEGDEIIVSEMEHHSNILPWKELCYRKGASLKVLPMDNNGGLRIEELENLITKKTVLVAVTYVSNILGTVNPVEEIIQHAHNKDVPVLIDGAQAVQHFSVDMQQLDCDFFVFSGHKMYAETGIGVLYGKEEFLEKMPPYQTGGGMIRSVSFDKTEYESLPLKFEAGTPNYAGALSLRAAIQYIATIGMKNIEQHDKELIYYMRDMLSSYDYITLYGDVPCTSGAVSFNINQASSYDVGMLLDKMGIAVRTGSHCAHPVLQHYGISGTVRASCAIYNSKEDIDMLIHGIEKAYSLLG